MDEQELDYRIQKFLKRKSRRFPNLNYEFSSRYQDIVFDEEEFEYENL